MDYQIFSINLYNSGEQEWYLHCIVIFQKCKKNKKSKYTIKCTRLIFRENVKKLKDKPRTEINAMTFCSSRQKIKFYYNSIFKIYFKIARVVFIETVMKNWREKQTKTNAMTFCSTQLRIIFLYNSKFNIYFEIQNLCSTVINSADTYFNKFIHTFLWGMQTRSNLLILKNTA